MTAVKREPMVSVVITAYNSERLLPLCLPCIISQRYPSFEVIVVVDGGSTDDTFEVVKKFRDERLRYFIVSHCGAARALNLGVKEAVGEIVVFLDHDAFAVDPYFIQKLVNNFDEDKIVGVAGRFITLATKRAKATAYFTSPQIPLNRGGYALSVNGGCWAVKKGIFIKLGGYDEDPDMAWDSEMASRIVRKGYRLAYDHNAWVYHFAHRYKIISFIKNRLKAGVRISLFTKQQGRFWATFWNMFIRTIISLFSWRHESLQIHVASFIYNFSTWLGMVHALLRNKRWHQIRAPTRAKGGSYTYRVRERKVVRIVDSLQTYEDLKKLK